MHRPPVSSAGYSRCGSPGSWSVKSLARWLFLTARPLPEGPSLGGIEQAVLHLSAALRARGHAVQLASEAHAAADYVVAVNDARLLPQGGAAPIVWFHNEVALWREMRRGRVGALRRLRPTAVFCGRRQAARASRFLPFGRRLILPHGLPEAIVSAQPAAHPPAPVVLFTSQAYRGLAEVVTLWRRRVAAGHPAARLHAYIAAADCARFQRLAAGVPSVGIFPRVANAEMPSLLRGARVLVAPGHAAETFCLAAAEAIAMGVPVVTLGRGALAERVVQGETGLVCRDWGEMSSALLSLLSDDGLWQRLHQAGLATRAHAGWDQVAKLWEDAFCDAGDTTSPA